MAEQGLILMLDPDTHGIITKGLILNAIRLLRPLALEIPGRVSSLRDNVLPRVPLAACPTDVLKSAIRELDDSSISYVRGEVYTHPMLNAAANVLMPTLGPIFSLRLRVCLEWCADLSSDAAMDAAFDPENAKERRMWHLAGGDHAEPADTGLTRTFQDFV